MVQPSSFLQLDLEQVSPLGTSGRVFLMRERKSQTLYVQKRLLHFDMQVYQALMEHPIDGTPKILDFYLQADGTAVVLEEYIMGQTIAQVLQERGVFTKKEAIAILRNLCDTLIRLHKQKPRIIHRDIKPENVMLVGEHDVVLLDFDAAKVETPYRKTDTVALGTVGFAAPEQYGFSPASPQTDIYALGVLLNVMLCGKLPSQELVSGSLGRVVRRCLQMRPRDRYKSAKELRRALRRARHEKVFWMIPGFRSLLPHRILLALVGYTGIFLFSFGAGQGAFITPQGIDAVWFIFLITGYGAVFYIWDWLGMRRFFPLGRNDHFLLRRLSDLLFIFTLFWATLLFVAVINGLFFPLL